MSIEAYRAAWAADCSGGLKVTLLAVADFASKQNGYTCSASLTTLADMVGTKPRQIERNMRELETAGLVITSPNRGRGNTNVYSIAHLIKPVIQDTKPVIYDGLLQQENPSYRTQNPSSRTLKPVIDDTQSIYNQMNQKNIYIHPDPEPIAAIKTALSKTTKTPLWAENEESYDKAAYMIFGWECSGDDVEAFGKWWQIAPNGHYPGKPALKSLVTEFPNFLAQRKTKQNGHTPIPDDGLAELMAKLEYTNAD